MSPIMSNRRQMLIGLAAASTAAASTVEAQIAENPDLMRLGDELPSIEAAYVSARDEKWSIYQKAMAEWPLAPKEVIRSTYSRASLSGEIERDVAGGGFCREGEADCFGLYTVEGLQSKIAWRERDLARILKTKRQKHLGFHAAELTEAKAALPKTKAYWAKCERIRKSCGYEAATEAEGAARNILKHHVDAIMAFEPLTMEGVVIQCQALIAWGNVDKFFRSLTLEAVNWPQKLAVSIIEQSST